MIADDFPYKTCSGCHRVLSIDSFRPRRRGGRESRCRPCLAAYMRQWRGKRRAKRLGRFTYEVRRAKSLTRVEALLAGMAGRFGGVHGLCRAYADSLRDAVDLGRTATAARLLTTIFHMAEVLYVNQRPRDVDAMTDEELEREFLQGTETLIATRPELAVAAAAQLGWTVIPPA